MNYVDVPAPVMRKQGPDGWDVFWLLILAPMTAGLTIVALIVWALVAIGKKPRETKASAERRAELMEYNTKLYHLLQDEHMRRTGRESLDHLTPAPVPVMPVVESEDAYHG